MIRCHLPTIVKYAAADNHTDADADDHAKNETDAAADNDNDNHTDADADADENAYITKLILTRLLQLEARNNDRAAAAAAAALQCIDTLTQWHSTLI